MRTSPAAYIIRLEDGSTVCEAREGETLLSACARGGIILSAPCGGRGRCGKCKVRVRKGQVAGDGPDADGRVRSCLARPVSDVVIVCPENSVILDCEVPPAETPSGTRKPRRTGVALDIGTTTVSARLVDLEIAEAENSAAYAKAAPDGSAAVLDTVSELNDQRAFGADVISRIGAARQGKTRELFTAINRQTERVLHYFRRRWGLSNIEKLAVSGNTVMLHLFLNVDPSGMGEVPFTPEFLEARELAGERLSLSVERVTVLPSISAFLGGDITAGLAALDITRGPAPSLLIDIGTNGEMALFNGGKILCCSAAAGPAFEGAEISCGMGGVRGAVSAVAPAPGGLELTTIGNAPARGICGSGLVDAVAVMLKQGIIDETGLMENHPAGYSIAPGVSLLNRDIRQFQLAKSAIRSGIAILLKQGGLAPDAVKNIYIAGGFGFFINQKNAVAAGVFPEAFLPRLSVCGNLSLRGAEACLAEKSFMERCGEIISRCSVVDLSRDPSFTQEFADNMFFPGN